METEDQRDYVGRYHYTVGKNWSLDLNLHSLVAQLANNLPAMRETWVQPLGREDLLEEGMATHSSILA